eukprot:m.31977 g.31977  ORF g.31977 m.31977 type:complete len:356 (-) comp8367_c0_seq1:110-1177(-)
MFHSSKLKSFLFRGREGFKHVHHGFPCKYKHTYRLVATDLDGTFMKDMNAPPWLQAPSLRNAAAARRLIDNGVYFVPISGRMTPCMEPLMDSVCEKSTEHSKIYVAGYNGGCVVGPSDTGSSREVVISNTIPEDATAQAISFCKKHDLLVKVYHLDENGNAGLTSCGDFHYDTEQAEFFARCGEYPYDADHQNAKVSLNDELRELYRSCPYFRTRLDTFDVDAIAAMKPFKLVALTNEPAKMMALAAQELSDPPQWTLIQGYFWFEFMPPGVNKGTGLGALAEKLGLSLEDCVAFGDSFNDIEMLEQAGLGIAMANAGPEVKKAAKYVSEFTNEEDGVGREIARLLEAGALTRPA